MLVLFHYTVYYTAYTGVRIEQSNRIKYFSITILSNLVIQSHYAISHKLRIHGATEIEFLEILEGEGV